MLTAGRADTLRNGRRSLLVAGVISVVIHLALIFNLHMEMPEQDTRAARVLEARLVRLQAVEPAITAPPEIVPPAPRPRPRPRPPRPVLKPPPVPPEPDPAMELPSQPANGEAPTADGAPVAAPPVAEAAPVQTPSAMPLPARLSIRFAVNLGHGEGAMGLGRAEYRWQREGSRYELQSTTESTGVIALFGSQKLLQTSIGEITGSGLQPEIFVIQRGTNRADSALFDWTEMSLKIVDSEKIQTLPLPAGTQDLMSVLFQFAFFPPAGDALQFSVVTGRKLETYRFSVIGEEDLRLRGHGWVKALHIRRPKTETDDGMDVWLDKGRFFLPVRIRSEQRRDSPPIELIASEILVPAEGQ